MSKHPPHKPHNTLAAERRKARHYGMQALYQWQMADAPLNEIEAEFRAILEGGWSLQQSHPRDHPSLYPAHR